MKEAIKELNDCLKSNKNCLWCPNDKTLTLAIEALEKQIPKEATTQYRMSGEGYWIIKCHECETVMEGIPYIANYCCKCGQAIKWGD